MALFLPVKRPFAFSITRSNLLITGTNEHILETGTLYAALYIFAGGYFVSTGSGRNERTLTREFGSERNTSPY